MELFLAIIGIILTVIFSSPIINLYNRFIDYMKRRDWSGKEYRKGHLQNKSHVAFDSWDTVFNVDDFGNCTQEYHVRVINVSQQLVGAYYVPVFSDSAPLTFAQLAPWARSRGKKIEVEVDTWNEKKAEGRYKVNFTPPITPGERRRFSYGMVLPKLFQAGDEYYNWDIEIPYYDLKCELKFSSAWRITHARWNLRDDRFFEQPTIEENSIRWKVLFPPIKTRLHLEFGLIKKETARLN